VLGPDGRPVPLKPDERSEPQRWLSIAAKDDLLADALMYFARGDDWFNVYKTLECLEMRFGGREERSGGEVSPPRLGGCRRECATAGHDGGRVNWAPFVGPRVVEFKV
jgi:hypothetical protein